MKDRIKDKLKDLMQYIQEFDNIIPSSFEEYKNTKEKAACERYVEKIMEAAVDIVFLIIKYLRKQIPDDDQSAFDIMAGLGIISPKTAIAMKSAKGMKNIISHQYNKIDDEIVFDAITNELLIDAKSFAKEIENWILKNSP